MSRGKFSVVGAWNDEPDYKAFARAMLKLAEDLEQKGLLQEMVKEHEERKRRESSE